MKGRTHIAFSVFLSLLLSKAFGLNGIDAVSFSAVLIIASLIPDIDDHHSLLGRTVKPFSYLVTVIFGHRGIFHSPLVPLFLALLLYIASVPLLGWAFLIGYLSHLALDSFTYAGVRWLYPSQFRIKGIAVSGGVLDFMLLLACIAGIIATLMVPLIWQYLL